MNGAASCGVTVGASSTGCVAYLTKRFPRLSETFILDEILGLESAGLPLRLYAIADPGEGLTQPDVRKVRSTVRYVRARGRLAPLKGTAATVAAHTHLALTSPSTYRAALAAAVEERRRSGTIRPFLDAGRLARSLQRAGAYHLHAAFAHGPASTARYVHLLTGVPYSFSAHAKDLYLSDPSDLAAKAASAAFVLTCSAAAAGELQRVTGSPHVILAYHGVDTARFSPVEPRDRGDETTRLLAVGRLVPKKGYPVLLDALRLLDRQGHRFVCRIVGGGDELDALTAKAEAFGLADRVAFVGTRTHQEVAEEYADADVFVQASVVLADGDRDGVPNSLLEAMASGLPVVATAVSGIPEAVTDEVSGLLAAPGDPADLARALARLLADRHLASRLGREARATVVERFDRRACAEALAPLFRPTTARRPVAAAGRG